MLSVAHHPLQIPVKLVFAVMVVLSIAFAEAYKAATPDLYAGNKHGAMSWSAGLLCHSEKLLTMGAGRWRF